LCEQVERLNPANRKARSTESRRSSASGARFDTSRTSYANFDALVARVLGQTFNAIERDRVETNEVFKAGRTARGDYTFEQPLLLDLFLTPPSAASRVRVSS
jgi:hypothetical protein